MKSPLQGRVLTGAISSGDSQGCRGISNSMIFTGIVLNDQGGGIMIIEHDTVGTIRAQMKHHEPIILFENAAPITISGKQQSLAISADKANTLGANDYKEPQSVCHLME